jgi:hypothetical protein
VNNTETSLISISSPIIWYVMGCSHATDTDRFLFKVFTCEPEHVKVTQ